VNIPGSMVYFPAHGLRRVIPATRRVRRALRGLDAAVRRRQVFHLWTHPTNLADETEAMFGGLREILERVAGLRAQGVLTVMSMATLAARVTDANGTGPR